MYINKLIIKNFRNIDECHIEPNNKINFIYGKNAQGKTNLIETIYYSSLFKSFRTNKNINLINKESESLFINLNISNNNVDNKLKISLDKRNNKNITLNGKKPDSKNFYRVLNSIIYFPDEISYLKNYPTYRRNLIDRSIFFINNNYINIYNKYKKCLKQRNIFLKSIGDSNDIWKDQLIEYGSLIIKERINYIERINSYLNKKNLSNYNDEIYCIKYNNYDKEKIKDDLFYLFETNSNKEKKYGFTLIGPHIDDFIFSINNNNINMYSSEGQKRSLLLSYKQAQLLDYKENYGYYPVLLFDDMGGELDSYRKTNIFNKILNNSGQVFITTMDIPDIDKKETTIFEVVNGNFSEFISHEG